jgi:hypothetical protein
MVGVEFAPLHGASDGSLHAALPPDVAAQAITRGWAEFHPLARRGMIAAPRAPGQAATAYAHRARVRSGLLRSAPG